MDRSKIRPETIELLDKIVDEETDLGCDWKAMEAYFHEKMFRVALSKCGSYRRAATRIGMTDFPILQYLAKRDKLNEKSF